MQTPKKIAVVGSGLVGSLLAIYLKKAGHSVHVYDRSPDIRKVAFSGRSINLVMSTRGWKTLEDIGLDEAVRAIGIPVDKRAIHLGTSAINYQYYGKEGEAIFSLSRGILNRKMIDLAEEAGVEFFFEQKIWDVTLADATLHVGETERGEWQELKYDLVFGSDGAFSRVRHRMQRQSMFNYSQEFLQLGYKELHIPANADAHFPDTADVIPDLVHDFFKNPTSALVTMKCFPWTFEDKVALIGDACHAIVPFYGHGMNAGFEDITVLYQMMQQYGDNWEQIFTSYEQSRKPNADAIAELSYRNFMEMSSQTADHAFILQKKIEKWFSDKHPDKWMPLYSRVTFSLQPYADALAFGNQQNEIMQEVMQMKDLESKWNSPEVEAKIVALLAKNQG